jgi:hypothetical protein
MLASEHSSLSSSFEGEGESLLFATQLVAGMPPSHHHDTLVWSGVWESLHSTIPSVKAVGRTRLMAVPNGNQRVV